jgi:hypothetical protein
MLIGNVDNLRKRTLRERIYEEVVRLILAGELPSGGWVDEKRVIDKLQVSRTPMVKKLRLLKGGSVPTFLVLGRCCTTSLPWTLEEGRRGSQAILDTAG